MELLSGELIETVKKVVNEKARYQKVMIIYDETVSSLTIDEVVNSIKENCVFNVKDINTVDETELLSGYKLIVYICCVNSFLKLKLNRSEFVNLYLPTDSNFFPFLLNVDNYVLLENCYIFIKKQNFDFAVFPSIFLSQVYHNFKVIKSGENKKSFNDYNIIFNKQEVINLLNEHCLDIEFLDVKILKDTGLSYEFLNLVDLILINGFILFLKNVKDKEFEMVDLYKSVKDSDEHIDKFHALIKDKTFFNLIYYNYNFLLNICLKAKEKILDFGNFEVLNSESATKVLNSVKQYAKNSNDIISYFYLFNYFGV